MTTAVQEAPAPRFQIDHKPDDHPDDWTEGDYASSWRRDFFDLGKANGRYKAIGLLMAAFARGNGSCIHPGNALMAYASGLHPIAVNKIVRDLIEDEWIELTHEATATSPRVFALRHPEKHCV